MRELTKTEGDGQYKAWQAKKKFAFINPDGVYPDLHAFFNDGFTAGLDYQAQRVAELEAKLTAYRAFVAEKITVDELQKAAG